MTERILGLIIPLTLTGSVAALILWLVNAVTKRQIDNQSPLFPVVIVLFMFLIPLPISPIKKLAEFLQNKLFITANQAAVNPQVTNGFPVRENSAFGMFTGDKLPFAVSDLFWISMKLITVIWLSGVILLLIWNAWRYLRFCRILQHNSISLSNRRIQEAYGKANSVINLHSSIPVYQSNVISTPMTVGILKPVIYIPEKLFEGEQLIYIFCHELAHIKYGHIVLKLIAQLTAILHWFNPVIWRVQHKVACACELSCDSKATSGFSETQRKAYGFTLLDMLEAASIKTPYIVSTFGDSKKQVRHRLKLLLTPKASRRKVCIALIMIAILFMGTGSVTAYASQNAVESISWAATLMSRLAQDPELFLIDSSERPGKKVNQEELTALSPMHWQWPVPDYTHLVSKPLNLGQNEFDLAAPKGTDILAAEDGIVIATSSGENSTDETENTYGVYLIIAHNAEPAVTTMYAHCEKLYVQEGDIVKAGQKIASVGNSGNSTGPHCHFELRINGASIDPSTVFTYKMK